MNPAHSDHTLVLFSQLVQKNIMGSVIFENSSDMIYIYYTCSFLLSIKQAFQLKKRMTLLCHYLSLRNVYFLFSFMYSFMCLQNLFAYLSVLILFIQKYTWWKTKDWQLVNLSLERHLIMTESLLGFLKHRNSRSNETPSKGTEKLPHAVQARELPCVAKMQLSFLNKQIFYFVSLGVEKESWQEVVQVKFELQKEVKHREEKIPLYQASYQENKKQGGYLFFFFLRCIGLFQIYPGTVMRYKHSSRKFNIKKKLNARICNEKNRETCTANTI